LYVNIKHANQSLPFSQTQLPNSGKQPDSHIQIPESSRCWNLDALQIVALSLSETRSGIALLVDGPQLSVGAPARSGAQWAATTQMEPSMPDNVDPIRIPQRTTATPARRTGQCLLELPLQRVQ
jgi:hypothetical protein